MTGETGRNNLSLKQDNRRAILHALHREGTLSRKQLAAALGLTPASISMLVGDMLQDGIVHEIQSVSGPLAGRPEVLLGIDRERFFALGLTLTSGMIHLSGVRLDGEVIFEEVLSRHTPAPLERVMELAGQSLARQMESYSLRWEDCVGFGAAVRGSADRGRGVATYTMTLDEQRDVPLRDEISRRFNVPAVVEQNVRCLAHAQLFMDKGKNSGNMLFIRCEIGIGSAIVVNGRLYGGSHSQAGELGHCCVVPHGVKCWCGQKGCLETMASVPAILRRVAGVYAPGVTPALHRLTQGKMEDADFSMVMEAFPLDPLVRSVVLEAVDYFTDSLVTYLRLLDTDTVVLYGAMFENKRYCQLVSAALESRLGKDSPYVIAPSVYNLQLENKCAALLAVEAFFTRGGKRTFSF